MVCGCPAAMVTAQQAANRIPSSIYVSDCVGLPRDSCYADSIGATKGVGPGGVGYRWGVMVEQDRSSRVAGVNLAEDVRFQLCVSGSISHRQKFLLRRR